jgi:hypothetical protein
VRFYYQVFVDIPPGVSVIASSRDSVAHWWQRSEAAKAALRALLQAGIISLEAGGMQDDLDNSHLAIVPADHFDSCTTVNLQQNGCLLADWLVS